MKLRIKKTDVVQVMTGNDKGKTGRVLEVYPDTMRILVEQVNIRAKHEKPSQNNQKGGIIHKEMPIHYSNVMLLDGAKNPTRIGIRTKDNGDKVRYAMSNDKEL
ncbi:MAG: 50S ribosomal protein L24 [Ignavibacteria bacterium]|jgi:large subunit ribosomal protein L24|nr:50S ribosomal protein L24 [Ignavibacteria bacterium]